MTKIAVVTGANRGIGFEVCRQLGQQGLHVVLTSPDEARGQEAVDTLRREGLEISHHPLDVTDLESVAALYRLIEAKFNRLDVLVNNGGISLDEGATIFDVSPETMRSTMEINFYGPLYLCRSFIPLMRRLLEYQEDNLYLFFQT